MTPDIREDLPNSRLPFAVRVSGTDDEIEVLARRCAPLGPIRGRWNWNWLTTSLARFYFACRADRDKFITCKYLDIDALGPPECCGPG